MSNRRRYFYPCHFVVDNSFDAAENPRDFEKVLHSPTLNQVWADMEKILISGKVKAIGKYNLKDCLVLLVIFLA